MKRVAMPAIALMALAASLPALAQAGPAPAGAPVILESAAHDSLVIAPGAVPAAPPGKLLTLTVDGVEVPLAPGTYRNAVLSVTDDIPVKYHDLPVHHFRTALYVENGQPVPARSVGAAVRGGAVRPGGLADARIVSRGDNFNGVMVTGEGKYTLDRPMIDFTGNGGNDFAGFGAAIMSSGKAEVTLNRPIIRTRGAIRPALFVGGDSVMHVNDAEIEVFNGTLPADYKFTVDVGKMMEVPWMLGLSGNVRASNLVDRGTMYFNRSHIRSQGWGVLSTDDNTHVRMYVKDSLIEAVEAGYGTYSIGDSVNHFSHSVIRAADVGGIMAANGSLTFTDGTIIEAGLYGVMMHSGVGGGTLTIDKGSVLRAGKAAIEVKGIGTTIVVDGATVTSGSGVILQGMENDDPFLKAMMAGRAPEGASAPPPGMGATGGRPDEKPQSPDIVGTFRNTTLAGDFWNGRTAQGGMTLSFEASTVTGRISTSKVAPASGQEPVRATYREIGNVVNAAVPSKTSKGLAVVLDAASRWTVTGTSYLTKLDLAPGAKLDAGSRKLVATVNGRRVVLRPGSYSGAITLTPQ